MANIIKEFRGEYGFLSNFYESPLVYNGVSYRNAEAAFQAQKDLSRSEEFIGLTASQAKSLGRHVALRTDWESVKVYVMYTVVLAKFSQNKDLATRLLNTGCQTILIEGNTWGDKFWGQVDGVGTNILGQILMLVRRELEM